MEERMSRSAFGRIASVLLTAVMAGALTLAPGTPASAAGCKGNGCTGKDPQKQGCAADGRTAAEFTVGNVRFELRRSKACNAAWTRVTSPVHQNTVFAQVRGGGRMYAKQALKGQHWTKMISDTKKVRACWAVWSTASPQACTKSY
jgi:hypothetical protein